MRFWGSLILLVLVATLAGGYYYVSRPQRVASYAGQLLEAMTGAEAHIDSATFSLNGTIDLRGLKLTVPGMQGQGAELFRAEQTLLRVDPWALLRGQFEAQQMMLFRPVLSLTEIGPDEFNYELLRKVKNVTPRDQMPRLPRVYLRAGRVAYGEVYAGEYQSWGVDVNGRLQPDADKNGLYRFELYQVVGDEDNQVVEATSDDPSAAPALTGKFDLESLEVSVQLAGAGLVNPHKTVMPRQVRKWWEMFEPSGALPQMAFEYDEEKGFDATVSFSDVSLTLPQLSTDEYQARMTGVSGTFRFDNDTITIENLVGQIEGLQYTIDGRIDGYTRDAPFQLRLRTLPFRIPEEPVYMVALRPEVLKVFQMLSPVGWMRVSLRLNRETEGGKIDYEGASNILSGRDVVSELRQLPPEKRPAGIGSLDPTDDTYNSRGKLEKFPYLLSNCRGLLTFNSRAIEVKHLTGQTPGGGSATITGTIGPPHPDAAVDLTVTAVGIQFDQALYEALPEKTRRGWDMFFNKARYRRMHERGHFNTPAEHEQLKRRRSRILQRIEQVKATDEEQAAEAYRALIDVQHALFKPTFELGGRGNAIVNITRPFGPGHKFTIHTSVDMKDAGVVFEFFPYPVQVSKGRITITPTVIEFDEFTGRGLHGGSGGLNGRIVRHKDDESRGIEPDLTLTAEGLPLSPLLYDALPDPQDDWLRGLRLGGAIDVDGRIFRDKQTDRLDIDMGIDIADAEAAPGSGKLKLTDLAGRLQLKLGSVTIEKITAKAEQGRIEFTGGADWSTPDKRTMHILANAEDLRFEQPVLDLISPAMETPTALAEFWARHAPAGAFDAKLEYAVAGEDARRYRLDIQPRSLSFDANEHRFDFTETTGRIIVEPDVVTLQQFAGTFDAGRFEVDGPVRYQPHVQTDLALNVQGKGISQTLRAVMPKVVTDVVKNLKLDGPYTLDLERVAYRDEAADEPGASVAGQLTLDGASMNIGLPITDFTGTIDFSANAQPDSDWPRVALRVRADRMRAAERPVEQFAFDMRNRPGSDRLKITDLVGQCAGGQIGGQGVLAMASGQYQLQLALSDAQLGKLLIQPDASARKQDDKKDNQQLLSGVLSASLSLEGSWRNSEQRRGRGDLIVRRANLYGVPLAVGLLKMTHLTLPVNDPFENAVVSYYLRGEKFVFENISLQSPTMQLAGRGAMSYPGGQLNLALTSSNPRGLKLGPFTDLVDGFRDQLMTIHITGTLDNPKTSIEQFSGLSKAWRDVFGEDAQAEVPTTP